MTLPISPNQISASQINQELGKASPYNQTFSINSAEARGLAGKPTNQTQIAYSDFWGKSSITVHAGSITAQAACEKVEVNGPNQSADSGVLHTIVYFNSSNILTNATLHIDINKLGVYSEIEAHSTGYIEIRDSLSNILFSEDRPIGNTSEQITRLYTTVDLSTFTLDLTANASCYTDAPSGYAGDASAYVYMSITAWFTT